MSLSNFPALKILLLHNLLVNALRKKGEKKHEWLR